MFPCSLVLKACIVKETPTHREHPGDQCDPELVNGQGVKSVILLGPLQQLFTWPGGSAAAVLRL